MDNPFFRAIIWPGLVLQNLTTREPDDSQLEIALASLRAVLRLEKGIAPPQSQKGQATGAREVDFEEYEIAQLSDLGRVQASVSEFPEA
jgi:hypothetical protein